MHPSGTLHEMGGHMGATKPYANAKRFYYWPRMFDWICALTADCLTCQNNKPKPKHRNEVPLGEWQNETVPFRTIHIDHKGPIHPISASNVHCFLFTDTFSRFSMIYPVHDTAALATITAVEKWIISFGIPQSIIHDRGTVLSIPCLSNRPKNLEILYDLVQLIHPGQMLKLKPRINILLDTGEAFLTMPEITGLH